MVNKKFQFISGKESLIRDGWFNKRCGEATWESFYPDGCLKFQFQNKNSLPGNRIKTQYARLLSWRALV